VIKSTREGTTTILADTSGNNSDSNAITKSMITTFLHLENHFEGILLNGLTTVGKTNKNIARSKVGITKVLADMSGINSKIKERHANPIVIILKETNDFCSKIYKIFVFTIRYHP